MPSPVGKLTLVARENALAAILWERERPGRVRLGDLTESHDDPFLASVERQLNEYFAGERVRFDVALRFEGTEFQKAVWTALLDIPYGETRTYGEIATQIHRPTAVRAVGAANGRNPISIIAPCHRVIGASGALTGFAGGLSAKETLLSLEGAHWGAALPRLIRLDQTTQSFEQAKYDMNTPVNSDGLVLGADGLARPAWAIEGPMRTYYDTEWGMPVRDERGLFERVSLEVFQSGLSWSTILHKREAFRHAFHHFSPDKVSTFSDADVDRLMADKGIVRNTAKIRATIDNAKATVHLRERGGLPDLIWSFRPSSTPAPERFSDIPTSSEESIALSKALRKHGFKFVGPTNMFALMEAIGMIDTHLVGSHRRGTSGVW